MTIGFCSNNINFLSLVIAFSFNFIISIFSSKFVHFSLPKQWHRIRLMWKCQMQVKLPTSGMNFFLTERKKTIGRRLSLKGQLEIHSQPNIMVSNSRDFPTIRWSVWINQRRTNTCFNFQFQIKGSCFFLVYFRIHTIESLKINVLPNLIEYFFFLFRTKNWIEFDRFEELTCMILPEIMKFFFFLIQSNGNCSSSIIDSVSHTHSVYPIKFRTLTWTHPCYLFLGRVHEFEFFLEYQTDE